MSRTAGRRRETMSFWVYILRCADGSYYTGHTDNLDRRIAQHQSGEIPGYTHDRRPVELMFSETFAERIDALERERQVKDWSRKKKEALFRSDFGAVSVAGETSRQSSRLRSTTARSERGEENSHASPGRSVRAPVDLVETGVENASPAPAPPPVLVLVRPQLGENIGKAARAMLNFGLTELRLVAPRDGWPNPDAGPSAAGADEVLAGAQIHETLADAIADCANAFAATVRKRGVTKPVSTPEQAAHAIRAEPGRSAIVFGPERSGLETDEVAICRNILTVPVNPEFGSLNLAQAVILCAYEWSKAADLAQPTLTALHPPAPQAELDGMIDQLEALLHAAGYFYPPDRTGATKRTLRTLLTKPGWNHLEVRTLRGVLSALGNPRQRD